MEPPPRASKPNPQIRSNWVAKTLLWWVSGLFRLGYTRGLDDSDVYDVLPQHSSSTLSSHLSKEWEKELYKLRTGGKPSLLKALSRCYWQKVAVMGGLLLIQETFRIAQAVLLGEFILFFIPSATTGQTIDPARAYAYAALLAVCYTCSTLLSHPTFHTSYLVGMKVKVACTSLMYRKALKLSCHSLTNTKPEEIIRLMTQDAQKLDQSVFSINYLWLGPVSTIVVSGLLWIYVGVALLAPLLTVLILVLPVQIGMGHLFSFLRTKTSFSTNTRVKVINEVLRAMRSIKVYCWETTFEDIVQRLRDHELRKVKRTSIGRAFSLSYFFSSAKVVTFAVFACAHLMGFPLSLPQVVVTMALLDVLRANVTLMAPLGVFYSVEAHGVVGKIQDFLLQEEKSQDVYSSWGSKLPADVVIEFENFSAFPATSTDKVSYAASLQKINISVKRGHLVVIVGPPGSGKTPMLMAMLGEIPRLRGFLRLKGKLSYATQSPWLFNGTVRENILFGSEFDRNRFNKVIKACDLSKDLEALPHADMTVVGEQGYELLLGVKLKINLARAVYRPVDIYLLDDPFGAVDSYVGRTIFNKCVCGLLKDSTVVLVTQQMPYVKVADQVIVMSEGNLTHKGTYESLAKAGVDFSAMLAEYEVERTPTIEASLAVTPGLSKTKRRQCGSQQLSIESLNNSLASIHLEALEGKSLQSLLPGALRKKKLLGALFGSDGTPWGVYSQYWKEGGGCAGAIPLAILCLISQASYVLADWWIIHWAEVTMTLPVNSSFPARVTITSDPTYDGATYLYVYVILTVVCILFTTAAAGVHFLCSLVASRGLHSRLFRAVVEAPLGDVERISVVELLKTFSQDVVLADDLLPATIFDTALNAGLILSTLVVGFVGNPWMLIAFLPMTILFVLGRIYYGQSAKDIKAIENRARYPVFSHLSSTLEGLWTIRALNSEERFLRSFDTYTDRHTGAYYMYASASRWAALVLDGFCCVYVMALAFAAALTAQSAGSDSVTSISCVSLSLVYAFNLIWTFQTTIRNFVEIDSQMAGIKRILDVSNLKPEALHHAPTEKIPPNWPNYGIVTFEGVSLIYPETGVKALRNVFCCFRAYEKIGVVGRTGAGKHSLVSAILRLHDPIGIIRVDGVDTSTLSLSELRSKIAVVPEDAPLFSGTLRQNLDVGSQQTDSQLWKILEEVNLKYRVESVPGRLYADMSQLLPHLSVGQRQLLCLARVLSRSDPKILIIEETMDNVEPRSAALLQKIVKRHFDRCTVITIARRLRTVIDSDRIMVIEGGRIRELDPPHVLLQNERGILNQLVSQRGEREGRLLREIARHKYENKPYVAPTMDQYQGSSKHLQAGATGPGGGASSPGYYIPSFQSSRLSAAFSHLVPHKEANKFVRKF